MRDIHDHAEAVHLHDDVAPEGRQAARVAVVARRAADVVAVRPGQRHVARAAVGERAQAIELGRGITGAEHVAALDADERAQDSGGGIGAHIGRRARDAHPLRVGARDALDRVDFGAAPRRRTRPA